MIYNKSLTAACGRETFGHAKRVGARKNGYTAIRNWQVFMKQAPNLVICPKQDICVQQLCVVSDDVGFVHVRPI